MDIRAHVAMHPCRLFHVKQDKLGITMPFCGGFGIIERFLCVERFFVLWKLKNVRIFYLKFILAY